MRKFLNKPSKEKESSERLPDVPPASGGASVHSEPDSLKELQPMFGSNASPGFLNDTSLNLNPIISGNTSAFSETIADKSVFSSRYTRSTNVLSHASSSSKAKRSRVGVSQPLLVLDIAEELELPDGEGAVAEKLHQLWLDINFILGHYRNSTYNLSTAVVNTVNCFKEFIQFLASVADGGAMWHFDTFNNHDVRRIMKLYLHYHDNLLQDDAYVKLKLMLCKSFSDFSLGLRKSTSPASSYGHIAKPHNYAIGANSGRRLPNQDAISRIIVKIAASGLSVKEQNGSFIAPIARGIDVNMHILCLYFGYPNLTEQHQRLADTVQDLYDDVHVVVCKNQIELASLTGPLPVQSFKLPFRCPADELRPPMSLSVSVENSARISGTMGGFIYPIIDVSKQPHLQSYANSKFAISCGHVCLDKREDDIKYPYISSPLSVLIGLYKSALTAQYNKCLQYENDHTMMESKAAYGSVLRQIDQVFPVKEVKVYDSKSKQEKVEMRNFPRHRFGQIIWGERTLIEANINKKNSKQTEKRLSDMAIIKVNKLLRCDQNFLGDDVAFNECDPSLMFDNLYVRNVIPLRRHLKELALDVDEVDSVLSAGSRDSTTDGLPVFKYGSTTKYTGGFLNGIKLVYWLDGAIHSSEFVVNSNESTTAFAAGGDSGSWILSKLEDLNPEKKGLGVVGMLHSYDGEFRQFGLFTPMTEILSRLEEVTKIKWGVVGVPEKDMDIHVGDDSENESYLSEKDNSEYESGVEEQANAATID